MPDNAPPEFALAERIATARELLAAKERVAVAVTDEFLKRHPDWVARYGDLARKRGNEDAAFHVDFLAGAIETGSTAAFCDYARWCSRVLTARNIAPQFLAENLLQIEATLAEGESASRLTLVRPFIRAAVACLDGADDVAARPASSPLEATRTVFLQAILSGRRKQAVEIAREALR